MSLSTSLSEVPLREPRRRTTCYGYPLPANYVNWLVGNGVVIVPGFGVAEWDDAARTTIEGFFPDRDVVVVEMLDVWDQSGGVHCITNDQPALCVLLGDLDCDCDVDMVDIMMVASHWHTVKGDEEYSPAYDLDGNDKIDIVDIVDIMLVAVHWEENCS